jgi:hypothetical protein
VSAGIDLLLTMARRHEPGRAEQLVDEVAAAIATKPGWHEWLWKLRLSQARAELALARGDFEAATADATDCVDQSRAHGRLKYEALGLMTRARARRGQNLARQAIDDARAAVDAARRALDPALQLATLSTLLDLEGSDELAAEARTIRNRIHAALPGEAMKRRFESCEIVRRLAS